MNSVISAIKRKLPVPVRMRLAAGRRQIQLIQSFGYDARRFVKFSSLSARPRRPRVEALITMEYHRLEKGLALGTPRPRFGAETIANLLRLLDEYEKTAERDEKLVDTAVGALQAYLRYHDQLGIRDFPWASRVAARRVSDPAVAGGTKPVTREALTKNSGPELEGFFDSRSSVRHFGEAPVSFASVEGAVRLAQRAPSVCNRQATRVHYYRETELKRAVLGQQNGNRGFGHTVDTVLVVTCDLGAFVSVGERNQAWVDGGMFAATLIWTLHSSGLGTCALNCSNEAGADSELRRVARIPSSEAIITMIAVGTIPDELNVAVSRRLPMNTVLTVHDGVGASR